MYIVSDVPISIDTRHSEVAKAAIKAGADIVNDVSGGNHDQRMLKVVSELQVPIILMHMRGTPETMQQLTTYNDVVTDVSLSLMAISKKAEEAGIPRWLQVLDPGIGFAKDLEQNLSLMKNMNDIREMVNHCPMLLGPSRKGFIGKITGEERAENRDYGTLAACLHVLQDRNGKGISSPTILRVHNVKGVKQGVQIYEAILKAK
jgi:dihydropteroate synthase